LSNKSEREELRRAGARPHKNSGRGLVKGDGSNSMFVIDVKEASKSFTLNESVWSKICTDAYKVDPYKHPQLLVVLGTERKKRLAIIESSVLQELMEIKEEYDNLRER
jgi:hypothetical protein